MKRLILLSIAALVNRYPVSPYLKQRLEIQEFGINSLFESDKSKQSSLDVFF